MRFASWLPLCRFLQHRDQRRLTRRSLCFLSRSVPLARNGLSLACNGCPFQSLHSKVNVPGLPLRSLAARFYSSFGPSAPPPLPVRPDRGCFSASSPLPLPPTTPQAALPASTPPWDLLNPSGSKRSTSFAARRSAFRTRPISVRSPPPSTTRIDLGCGSTFPVRYVSGGLLFLKPLGTFPNMPWKRLSVKQFLNRRIAFPQDLSVVFLESYDDAPVDSLCIKHDGVNVVSSGSPPGTEPRKK